MANCLVRIGGNFESQRVTSPCLKWRLVFGSLRVMRWKRVRHALVRCNNACEINGLATLCSCRVAREDKREPMSSRLLRLPCSAKWCVFDLQDLRVSATNNAQNDSYVPFFRPGLVLCTSRSSVVPARLQLGRTATLQHLSLLEKPSRASFFNTHPVERDVFSHINTVKRDPD
jgi:hypothetical protein